MHRLRRLDGTAAACGFNLPTAPAFPPAHSPAHTHPPTQPPTHPTHFCSDEEVKELHPAHTQASIRALLPRLRYFDQGTCIVHHLFGGEVTELVRQAGRGEAPRGPGFMAAPQLRLEALAALTKRLTMRLPLTAGSDCPSPPQLQLFWPVAHWAARPSL